MKKYLKSILCIVLLFAMTALFAGCDEVKKAEKTVNNMFSALKKLDFEAASKYIDLDEVIQSGEEFDFSDNIIMEKILGNLDYKIISTEKTDANTAIVKTEITAIDMQPVLTDYIRKALEYTFANAFSDPQPTEEEISKKMEEIFVECISKEGLETVTNEVEIKVVKAKRNWKIESTDELSHALLGGLYEAVENIENSFSFEE